MDIKKGTKTYRGVIDSTHIIYNAVVLCPAYNRLNVRAQGRLNMVCAYLAPDPARPHRRPICVDHCCSCYLRCQMDRCHPANHTYENLSHVRRAVRLRRLSDPLSSIPPRSFGRSEKRRSIPESVFGIRMTMLLSHFQIIFIQKFNTNLLLKIIQQLTQTYAL